MFCVDDKVGDDEEAGARVYGSNPGDVDALPNVVALDYINNFKTSRLINQTRDSGLGLLFYS